MLDLEHPKRLLVAAVCMLLFGCITPFLMMMKLVESTLFINFFSFAVSTLGLFIGIIGIAMYRGKQNKSDDEEKWEG